MDGVWQQMSSLLGVVVGAAGSFLVTALTERNRSRRESIARWSERRLTVYGEYARAQKDSIATTMRMAAHLGNDPYPHTLTPDQGAEALARVVAVREPA